MQHDGRHKLIWYPAGNHQQLFDIEDDPLERRNLIDSMDHQSIRRDLTQGLIDELYGSDLDYIRDGDLVGFTATAKMSTPDRDLYLQRGLQYPPPRG